MAEPDVPASSRPEDGPADDSGLGAGPGSDLRPGTRSEAGSDVRPEPGSKTGSSPALAPDGGADLDLDLPPGFPTQEFLDAQTAATEELRESLEELRRVLDAPLAPPPPRRPRRRRVPSRAIVLGALTALVVVIALVALIATLLPRPGDSPGTRPAPTPAPDTAPSRTPTPAAARPSPETAAAPLATGLPSRGPGVDAPGAVLVVRPGPRGSLDVVEQVVLRRPVAAVGAALPRVGPFEGALAGLRPRVIGLRAALDGEPVPVARTSGGWRLGGTAPASTVLMSYRLTGVTVTGAPARDGRALALAVPLLGGRAHADGLPLLVHGPGRDVLGITCPGAPARQQACGTAGAVGWTATLPRGAEPAALLELALD